MKKLGTILQRLGIFTLVMVLLLTGCSRNAGEGDTDSDTGTTGDTESETTEAPTTTEEEPEEPPEPVAIDESACKLALISITSKVCESKDETTGISGVWKNGEYITDWTGVTVYAYSFVMEGVTPETSWFSPDIFNKSTGEDLSDVPGKSSLICNHGCRVYDIETEYSSIYDVERDITLLFFYTTEEIPVENLEFRANMNPDGSGWVDAVFSVNSSIDDLSINPSMATCPLLKIKDSIYICSGNGGAGGGVGPEGTGDFDYHKYPVTNLSNLYSEEIFSADDIEGLQYVDGETLDTIEISGCSPLWDVTGQSIRLGYYSDTELPDWSTEDNPLLTGYEKITIDGNDIILRQ